MGDRMDVFEKTPPHCLYLPNGTRLDGDGDHALHAGRLLRARHGGHPMRRIGPEGIALTPRGQGANTRHINNIAMEAQDWCDSLLVTEVFTPAGQLVVLPAAPA